MAENDISKLVADPDFGKLSPAGKREMLAHVTGDGEFRKLSDPATMEFLTGQGPSAFQSMPAVSGPNETLAKATSVSAPPKPFTAEWAKQKLWRMADTTADAMPAIGATVGSIIGGTGGSVAPGPGTAAGAIGGAGIGGMGGEAAQQLMRRALGYSDVPRTSQEAANAITKQGVIQAGIQVPAEVLPFLAGLLKKAATTQYERALAPQTKINKAIARDIAPGMIKRGERGSIEGLEKKAGEKIADLNPKLNTAFGQLQGAGNIPASGTKVIADLETLKRSYMPGGVVAQPQALNAIQGVQDIVAQYGPDVSPTTLRRLRQIFEDPVAQRGGFAGADLSTNYTLNAQKAASDSIRGILNKAPNIGELNKEISFWLDVQRVTRESGLRRTGQEGGLMKTLTPIALGTVASTTGLQFGATTGMEAGLATALSTFTFQAMRSPAWRTTSAVFKTRFADALASGDIRAVVALLGRVGVKALESKKLQEQPSPPEQPSPLQGQKP